MANGNINSLNRASPDTLPDQLRVLELGNLLAGQIPQVARGLNMVAKGVSLYNISTVQVFAPEGHQAGAAILRATVTAGGVTGELTPVAYGATPATTQIAVAPNGSIVTLAADAITGLDVTYIPERGDVVEFTATVVADAVVLSRFLGLKNDGTTPRKAVMVLEVDALAGAVVGKTRILVPGAAPATTQSRLNVAKDSVLFAAADAVTKARVKVLVTAAADLTNYLTGTDTFS